MLKKGDKKLINAWAFYDWANSVYSLVIGTAVFPLYYSNITEGATVSFLGTEWEHPDTLYSYAYFISHCRLYWKQKAFSSNFLLDRLVIRNVFILF